MLDIRHFKSRRPQWQCSDVAKTYCFFNENNIDKNTQEKTLGNVTKLEMQIAVFVIHGDVQEGYGGCKMSKNNLKNKENDLKTKHRKNEMLLNHAVVVLK